MRETQALKSKGLRHVAAGDVDGELERNPSPEIKGIKTPRAAGSMKNP